MKIQSRIWLSIAASLAVSGVLSIFVFSSVRGIGEDLVRGREYSDVIQKAFALNLLVATFGQESGPRHMQQFDEVRTSLTRLLEGMTSSDAREESLIRQIQRNNRELDPLLAQFLARRTEQDGLQAELKKMLATQLWTKVHFISDDTSRLMEFSESRIVSAYTRAGITVLFLLVGLIAANVIISLISGRSIVRTEEELRMAYGRLQTFFDHRIGGIGIVIANARGDILQANDYYLGILGCTREELRSGQVDWRRMTPPEWLPADERALAQLWERGVCDTYEKEYVRRDGSRVPVLITNAMMPGESSDILAFVLDITERKRAEEERERLLIAVREEKDRLSALVNSIQDEVWFADTEKKLTLVNPSVFEQFGTNGLQGEQVEKIAERFQVVRPDGTLRPPYEAPPLRALRGEVVEAEEEIVRTPAGGELRHRQVNAAPVKDAGGNIIGSVSVVRDITERKRMEEELRKSRDDLEHRVRERTAELETYMKRLQESNQALQDFASIASHDMQEPLRKVISFGGMLKEGYGDAIGKVGTDYLDRMLKATGRMRTLLDSLLDYSRVTTKAEPFREVDLNAIVQEVISDLEVMIARTGGQVDVGELPVISAEPTQMRQLFQNLIGNALKFQKEGEKPLVKVHCTGGGGQHLQIAVEDNGIGFEEKYLDRIFAPFQRLHGRSSRYEGTGMGLAICKKIVERHGGSITARSEPGKGSTFLITLPIRQNAGRL